MLTVPFGHFLSRESNNFSMRRILVPTDFSTCAGLAVDTALLLAKQTGADLLFLHLAIDKGGLSRVSGKPLVYTDTEIGQARHKLDLLVKRAENEGVNAKSELVMGSGQEKIEDYIKPYAIDWLVMGSHGATGLREKIIGSKTQQVIRNVKVPSLVVKRPLIKGIIKDIVFASTFKYDVGHALKVASHFVSMWNGTLHLLFVNLLNHLIEEKVARLMMTKQIEKFPDINYTLNITETNDEEFGIAQFAKTISADAITVPMESKSLIGRLINPNLAEQLINHSPLPVLVANVE